MCSKTNLKLIHILKSALKTALVTIGVCTLLIFTACKESDDDQLALLGAAVAALQSSSSGTSDGGTTTPTCATTGPCKMFATAVDVNVTGGIAGLDSACASDSNKPSGGGTYKAMVADGTNRIACTTANCGGGTGEHTDWVLKPNKEYRQKDGTTVIGTTTANGVFTFPLSAPIQALMGSNSTVTGLNANWTSNGNDCTNFSTTSSTSFALGSYDQTSNLVVFSGTVGCVSTGRRLICAEQ